MNAKLLCSRLKLYYVVFMILSWYYSVKNHNACLFGSDQKYNKYG